MREKLLIAVAAIGTVGCLLPLSTTLPASAGDDARRHDDGKLPGVDPTVGTPGDGKRTETQRDTSALPAPRHGNGTFRVGNWDVRISGSVSYEIGFGSRPHER